MNIHKGADDWVFTNGTKTNLKITSCLCDWHLAKRVEIPYQMNGRERHV